MEVDDASLLDIVGRIVDLSEGETDALLKSPWVTIDELVSQLKPRSESFSILSSNIQSLNAKIDTLKVLLTTIEQTQSHGLKFDAICIQETWQDDDINKTKFEIPGYKLIPQGYTVSSHGGLAIYLSNQFSFEPLYFTNDKKTWEQQFIKITGFANKNQSFTLGNIYRQPKETIEKLNKFKDEFTDIIGQLQKVGPVIVGGDYNIDLLKLDENHTYESFYETVTSLGFFPRITSPTRVTKNSKTLIDNFYCAFSDKILTSEAGVLHQKLSDHQPYFISIDLGKRRKKKENKYIEIRRPTENALENMKTDLANINFDDLLTEVETKPVFSFQLLNVKISEIYNKYYPLVTVKANKYNHKQNKWITFSLIRSIKFRDKLHKKLNNTPEDDPHYEIRETHLKNFNTILRRSIKLAKKMYFDECFLKHQSDMRKTWKTINEIISKSKNSNSFPDEFNINNETVNDNQTISNEFNKYFSNVGPSFSAKIPPSEKTFMDFMTESNMDHNFKFKTVTEDIITKIIIDLKCKSSSGWDGISTNTLKNIKDEIVSPLTKIINSLINHNIFPDDMKIAKVIPLFKKGDPKLLENYRPISLLTAFSKVYERVIFNQLMEFFLDKNLIYESQYGFRPGHSTNLAALEFVNRIVNSLDRKNQSHQSIAIFMDLSKAFDTLNHEILLQKLQHYGLSASALSLMKSYLSNRVQYVKFQNFTSSHLPLSTGVPQGSILGPILFIIYMNDIRNSCANLKSIIYADDTTLHCNLDGTFGKASDELISQRINAELEVVNDWMRANKLSLNSLKTKFMIFQRPKSKTRNLKIVINGQTIEQVETFSFLGLVLNSNLTWDTHMKQLKIRLSKTIGILGRVRFYLSSKILLYIYNALFLSHVNFHILVWGSKCNDILKLQKRAMRIIHKRHFLFHADPLFKESKSLKVEDIYKVTLLKFYYKFIHKQLPKYFLSIQIKTNSEISVSQMTLRYSKKTLYPPDINHTYAEWKLTFSVVNLINSLPSLVKNKIHTHSIEGLAMYFKRNVIIPSYEFICQTRNCFPCKFNDNT